MSQPQSSTANPNASPLMRDNEELSTYFVTKHSWKGKYKRLFSVGTLGITTYNPSTLEITNQWPYGDVVSLIPTQKSANIANEFQFTFRKGPGKSNKTDQLRFTSEHRADLLTDVLRYRSKFGGADSSPSNKTYNAHKFSWSEKKIKCLLELCEYGMNQIEPESGKALHTYPYKDIDKLVPISDLQDGIALFSTGFERIHIFVVGEREDFMKSLVDFAGKYVCVPILRPKDTSIRLEKWQTERFGSFSSDESITSYTEFLVYRVPPSYVTQPATPVPAQPAPTPATSGDQQVMGKLTFAPLRRLLCLTERCLLERDPSTYAIISLRPLADVFAIVRNPNDPQLFSLEFIRGKTKHYTSTERDSLIASLLDAVRASGNRDVCVRMGLLRRSLRCDPLFKPLEEEVESQHVKFLYTPPPGISFVEIVERFNANVPYSGVMYAVTGDSLFAENKEKLINLALTALINSQAMAQLINAEVSRGDSTISSSFLEQIFQALRRLVASKAGYACFTQLQGFREKLGFAVIRALNRGDEAVSFAAIDLLNALMEPMHDDYELAQEQLNKRALLSTKKFLDGLLELFRSHILRGTGALVIAAILDFLTFALCTPYSETTDAPDFDALLEALSKDGRVVYKLFQHPSMAIIKGAGLVLRAIILEADPGTANKMQEWALSEGAFPRHLLGALYAASLDSRVLTNRQLSRHLIALWCANNDRAMELLNRILPRGLYEFLNSKDDLPQDAEEIDRLAIRDNLKLAIDHQNRSMPKGFVGTQLKGVEKRIDGLLEHWRTRMGVQRKKDERPITLRNPRKNIDTTTYNWSLFYYQFNRDHSRPNLIWNFKTREELREALENEMRLFSVDKEIVGHMPIAWNFTEFEVNYASLSDEIKIGDYYLRLLLEEDSKEEREGVTYSSAGVGGTTGSTTPQLQLSFSQPTSNGEATDAAAAKASSGDSVSMTSESSGPLLSTSASALNVSAPVTSIAKRPVSVILRSAEFFNDLYHRFLLTMKPHLRLLCLQAMAIVYGRHYSEIGAFNDTRYVINMLDKTTEPLERDRLLYFINKLILFPRNVKEILDVGGIRMLVDLVTLAHLHVTRAYVPTQTQAIEAGPHLKREGEKEWYYGTGSKDRNGPFSFDEMKELYAQNTIDSKTRVWSQGLEGWKPLTQVPQLKWCLLPSSAAGGNLGLGASALTPTAAGATSSSNTSGGLMNESELAHIVLNMLLTIVRYYPSRDSDGSLVRPLPRAKRLLSESHCLNHIIQLLLTFDPVLVEKVALLLNSLMEDNPALPQVYTTGVFYFILMYTGSNLLPIARFLKSSHMKQAFRSEIESASDVTVRSVLAHMLPEAMLWYLENYPAEKFAQVFLGEFDNPEVIWNSEMRRHMIEKIASHLGDFSPRLQSNTRALYQYCSIPIIVYPQLENELYVHIYYLRHFCDEGRFPNWQIKDGVQFLKDLLEAWKREIEKKGPLMSTNDAFVTLGLDGKESHEEGVIRKAYYKLAQKYHPDKNPEGRDMFDKVNKAYEFLCTRTKLSTGPHAPNILLLLKAQSILFRRCKQALNPYKYAGYPMLISTIKLETADVQLFKKETPLLPAAAELTYYTMDCSALNAEELRRELGIEMLQDAFSRCVAVLTFNTKPTDLAAMVCENIAKCYTVAAQFDSCRMKMLESPAIVRDLCRCLQFKNLPQLNSAVAECISAVSVDLLLQTNLFKQGILFHLLQYLFQYDFTLEEGGVEKSHESNQQEVANRLAILCLKASTSLAGLDGRCHENPQIKASLLALLSPYIARRLNAMAKLAEADPETQAERSRAIICDVLKMLNSNSESPYLIWNNSTRAELAAYLKKEEERLSRTGECDPSYGANMKYAAWERELIIGDIFVRVYNEQKHYPLDDPKKFAIDLLDNISDHISKLRPQALKQVSSINENDETRSKSGSLGSSDGPATTPSSGGVSTADDLLSLTPSQSEMNGETLTPIPAPASQPQVYPGSKKPPPPPVPPKRNSVINPIAQSSGATVPSTPVNEELGFAHAKQLQMAIEALLNVTLANPGIEMQCIGRFRVLFHLITLVPDTLLNSAAATDKPEMRQVCAALMHYSIEFLHTVIANAECVNDIAISNVLHHMLLALELYPTGQERLLDCLHALASNTKLIKEFVVKGGTIYLLDLYANSTVVPVRVKAAELFAKLFSDKLVGPRIRIHLSRFLPSAFLDAMRDSVEASVHMFETVHENPELIWSEDARKRLCEAVRKMKDTHYAAQRANPAETRWSTANEANLVEEVLGGRDELIVGGVYIRLFVQNPNWGLRKPRDFLIELFQYWIKLTQHDQNPNSEVLEMTTSALVALLQAHRSSLLDQVPQLGFVPRVFSSMQQSTPDAPATGSTGPRDIIAKSSLLVCNALSGSTVCIRSMASVTSCMTSMQAAMRARRDCLQVAVEALFHMFDTGDEDLMALALGESPISAAYESAAASNASVTQAPGTTAQPAANVSAPTSAPSSSSGQPSMLEYLLSLLEAPHRIESENVRGTIALLVKAIKAMQTKSTRHSERINQLLDNSTAWKQYKDQNHDLFLTGPAPIAGYLTSTTPNVAGYLTSGPMRQATSSRTTATAADPFLA